MYIAMNRFKIVIGKETQFEDIWRNRDSHLKNVPFWQDPRGFNYVKNYYTKILMDPSI